MPTADPTKLKVTKNVGINSIALCVARVPNSQRLFFGSSDFKIYDVDLAAEKPEPKALTGDGHQSYVTGVALTNNTLISGSYDGRLLWWNTETRESTRAVDAHKMWIRRIALSPNGKLLASVADDMQGKIWNAETGDLMHTLADHKPLTPHDFPSMLFALAFSNDGSLLATGDKVGHVAIWEVATGKKVGEIEAPGLYTWDPKQRRHSIGGIRSLAFSADAKLLAAGGIGHIGNIDHLDGPARIEIFDWQSGKRVQEINDKQVKGLVQHLVFDREGKWILGAGGDSNGFASFYSLENGQQIHSEKFPMHVHQFDVNESQDAMYAVGHHRIAIGEFKTA